MDGWVDGWTITRQFPFFVSLSELCVASVKLWS